MPGCICPGGILQDNEQVLIDFNACAQCDVLINLLIAPKVGVREPADMVYLKTGDLIEQGISIVRANKLVEAAARLRGK